MADPFSVEQSTPYSPTSLPWLAESFNRNVLNRNVLGLNELGRPVSPEANPRTGSTTVSRVNPYGNEGAELSNLAAQEKARLEEELSFIQAKLDSPTPGGTSGDFGFQTKATYDKNVQDLVERAENVRQQITEKEGLIEAFARSQSPQPAPGGGGPHIPRVTFRQEPIGPSTGLEDRVEKELLDEFARIEAGEQQPAPAGAPVGPKLEPGALAAADETWGFQVPSGALPPTGPGVQQQPAADFPRFEERPQDAFLRVQAEQAGQAPTGQPPEVVQHPISSYRSGTDLESRGIAPDEFRGRQATPAELARQAGAYQAALGAQLDQAHAAGEKSGYGTEPYAVRNNMIVDPLPLSERPVTQRDQDAAQRGRDMALNQFKAGRGDPSWSDVGYEGKEGTGPRFNWSNASDDEKREYVDLQRQIGGVSGRDDLALDMPAITGASESYLPPERYREREEKAKELYKAGKIRHPSLRAMDKYDRAKEREDRLALAAEPGKTTRFKKAQVRGAQRALRGANTKGEKIAALSLLPGDVLSDPVALAAFDPSGKMASAALEKQKMDAANKASERAAEQKARELDITEKATDSQIAKATAETGKLLAETNVITDPTAQHRARAMNIMNSPGFPELSKGVQGQIVNTYLGGIGSGSGDVLNVNASTAYDLWKANEYDIEAFMKGLEGAGITDRDEINKYGRKFYGPKPSGEPYDDRWFPGWGWATDEQKWVDI